MRRRKGRDPEKVKAYRRRYYLKHKAYCDAKAAAARKPYGQWTPEKVARSKALKRKYREQEAARQGRELLPPNGAKTFDQLQSEMAEQNAKEAWRWWLKTCPDRWLVAYWLAHGQPWRNPRLSSAEQFRLRYSLDPEFADKQRDRTRIRKYTNPEYAAQWERYGSRWLRAAVSADGTVTRELCYELLRLKRCHYCQGATKRKDREIDHVVALANGGAHTACNLVMACKACNRAKRDKPVAEFVCEQRLSQSVPAQLIHGALSTGPP